MTNNKIIDLSREPGEVYELEGHAGFYFIHDGKLVPISQAERVLDDSERQNKHRRRLELLTLLLNILIVVFVMAMSVAGLIFVLNDDQDVQDMGKIVLSSCVGAVVGYALGIAQAKG